MTKQTLTIAACILSLMLADLASAAMAAEQENARKDAPAQPLKENPPAENSAPVNPSPASSTINAVAGEVDKSAAAATAENTATTAIGAETAAVPAPPDLTKGSLRCPRGYSPSPYIVLGAKKKLPDRSLEDVTLGCVLFANNTETLDDKATKALNDAVAYLMKLPNVVRVYINLPSASSFPTRADERHFRRRAFAIKEFLTDKGIYAHLENNEALLAQAELAKKKPPQPVVKKVKSSAPKSVKPVKPAPKEPEKLAIKEPELDPVLFPYPKIGLFQFVPMQHINFDSDKAVLTATSKRVLDAAAQYIANNTKTERVLIIGHTDEAGTHRYNEGLGNRRAVAVREYLAKLGVPPGMLVITARGERTPIDENWTPEGRTRNRHVEIHVVLRDNNHLNTAASTPSPSAATPL